jgi:hypothetical protein
MKDAMGSTCYTLLLVIKVTCTLHGIATAIVSLALLGQASNANAAEPTSFAVLTSQKGELPKVTLKGELRTRIDGDTPLEESKIQLRIDGELLNVSHYPPVADLDLDGSPCGNLCRRGLRQPGNAHIRHQFAHVDGHQWRGIPRL